MRKIFELLCILVFSVQMAFILAARSKAEKKLEDYESSKASL
jgi:NADH:ubiquinone oxidoreductase subunit 3 (subunit A)